MCTAVGDSDYYCLQDEQLDVVLRVSLISILHMLSLPVRPWRVTKEVNVSKIMLHFLDCFRVICVVQGMS